MGPVNVAREDPKQKGLLFAGTEREVYFSIDDGDRWQSLRMNMPASSVRDLVVHEDDIVVGTHGRSIWILDNIAPLRELAQAARSEGGFLFSPPRATRVRWNMFSDTPLPPEEPAGQNPPDGAILDYYLPRGARAVTLEIVDAGGDVIRTYASDDTPEWVDPNTMAYPTYWIRPPQSLGTKTGHHRFVWDLRHEPPRGARRSYSIAAVHKNTPSGPKGPFVHPGTYTVRLTADDSVLERPLEVRLDPRVDVSAADVQRQTDDSMACYQGYLKLQEIREAIDARAQPGEALTTLRGTGSPGDPDTLYGSIYEVPPEEETLVGLQHKFLFILNLLQNADAPPTPQAVEAVRKLEDTLEALTARWEELR
jgi:hypothetical protein